MRFGLNRGTTGAGLPLDRFVHLAAQAGFQAADLDWAYGLERGSAAVRDLYAQHGIGYGAWGVPFDWRGNSDQSAGLKQFEKCAALAAELNVDSCGTWIMPSSDLPFIETWNHHVARLRAVAKVLADHGRRLGLEFVAPYHLRRKFKHEFIFSPGLMLELADAAGPNVGLLVDVFHCHCAGMTWEHLASLPAQKIVLCHLNDAPRVPLAEVQDGQRVLPGEGAIDIRGFLAAVAKTGFEGPVSLEVFNAELKALPPHEAARKAWQAMKQFV